MHGSDEPNWNHGVFRQYHKWMADQEAERQVTQARAEWPRFRELEKAIRQRIKDQGDPCLKSAYLAAWAESELTRVLVEPTPEFAKRVDDEVARIFAKAREVQ